MLWWLLGFLFSKENSKEHGNEENIDLVGDSDFDSLDLEEDEETPREQKGTKGFEDGQKDQFETETRNDIVLS